MKNRYTALFLSLGLPLLLTSCKLNPEDIHPEGPPFNDQNELVTTVNNYLANQQKRYNCFASGQSFTVTDYLTMKGNCSGGTVQSTDKGRENAQNVRNETIEQALFVIDANYGEWVNYLYLGRATGNFVADTVQLTTSGVIGALNGPADTLRVLGVALNTFQGARSSFDLNYFDKQNTAIIINQMDSNRSKAYAVILAKKKKDITEYSMAEAIKDMVAYYNAGTLVGAFTALSQQTAIKSQESADAVLVLQGIPLSKPATEDSQALRVKSSDTIFKIEQSLASLNPIERNNAVLKLQSIFSELEKNPEFKTNLSFFNISPKDSDGEKLKSVLIEISRRARTANNYDLLNIINQAIIDFGN